MAKKKIDQKQYWTKIKKKSPKYPDFTCPSVDDILERIAKVQSKQKLSQWQHKLIIKGSFLRTSLQAPFNHTVRAQHTTVGIALKHIDMRSCCPDTL